MDTQGSTKGLQLLKRYPVASYTLLALVLGCGAIALVVLGALPDDLALVSVLSASAAGIIMTALLDGKAGLKLMIKRAMNWRVGIGYWIFAVLFIVPVFLLGAMFNPLFQGDPVFWGHLRPGFNLLPMFVLFVLVVGFGQELGWSGFLMPRLQARFNALTACILRAAIVGLWHLPLFIYSWRQPDTIRDFPYGAWIQQKGFLVAFFVMMVLNLVWSILYAWIFNNTQGSLLLVAVLHGSEIWTAYWMVRLGIDPNNLDNYWGYGVMMVLAATGVVLMSGPKELSRQDRRVVHEQNLS
jgi:uncharacterized protein